MANGRISGLRAVALALPLGCAAATVQAADIAEMIAKSGQFQTFNELIEAAELTEDMSGEGPFTVFAPTDEAFLRLPEGTLDALLAEENREELRSLLAMHVVDGEEITPQDVAGTRMSVTTVAGDELTLDGTSQVLLLVPTGLTVARVGDRVLVQREEAAVAAPAIAVRPDDGAEANVAPAAGEHDEPPARYEPQDEATRALLREAIVTEPNIEADNGVIHAIDAVLVPPRVQRLGRVEGSAPQRRDGSAH